MNEIKEIRDAIARSIRSVRLSCAGRKCLKACVGRMAAAAPHPRAMRRRWGVAVAAALLCLAANAVDGFGGITCQWHPELGQYLCEGTGNQIWVTGSGGNTVTNIFGGCTNCINVTPQECFSIKSTVSGLCDDIQQGLGDIRDRSIFVHDQITENLDDIATYRRFGYTGNSTEVREVFPLLTNYVFSVVNGQTQLVRLRLSGSSGNTYGQANLVGFNDGVYDYANSYSKPVFQVLKGKVDEIYDISFSTSEKVQSLSDTVDQRLNCSDCPGSDSGDCDCNESTGGRWCTEEQGDAIIELLRDTKDYVEKMKWAVISISNNVQIAVQNLHDGFFTAYTHIPTEEELGHTWQELYLEGYSPNFHEYAATNILARIELLLAGMSGVLTNDEDFVSAGEFAESGMSATNQFESIQEDFTNQVGSVVEQRERNIRSVGDALVGFYNTFRGWSGTPFSRTTLINSYSVEIGDNHWDVPAFEPSQQGISIGNIIRVICRSVMSVFYILFTVVIFVRFHIAFFQWVLKYLKWAIELMQGLFA